MAKNHNRLLIILAGIILHFAVFSTASAQSSTANSQGVVNPKEVRLWASSCAACHGTDGKAEGAGFSLAGHSAEDLYKHLIGYKNGTIPATVMHQHAKGYSDHELRLLAEHFAAIK
jgi:cytochrome subunit of sulfide dehydrogenase